MKERWRQFKVLHHCRSKCPNPRHLYAGNHSQNALDSFRDGRIPLRGEASSAAVLTEGQVLEILRLANSVTRVRGHRPKEGLTYEEIGARFGIRKEAVYRSRADNAGST